MTRWSATLALTVAFFSAAHVRLPPSVYAHGATRSYSTWENSGERVQVTVRVPLREFQRLFPTAQVWTPHAREAVQTFDRAVAAYLQERLTLYAGEAQCSSWAARSLSSANPAYLAFTWDVTCPNPDTQRVRSDLFFDAAPDHLHFVTLVIGKITEQAVLTSEKRAVSFQSTTFGSLTHQAWRFARLGIEHVLTGADHIIFLLTLLLLGGSLGWMVRVATGFTLAHSLTLALSVLGVVRPPPATVEALVGLSIVYVAVENFWLTGGPSTRRSIFGALLVGQITLIAGVINGLIALPLAVAVGMGVFVLSYLPLLQQVSEAGQLRWAIAFLFGLIHGFAFAGFLLELNLPTETLTVALAGFNVGVEGGQLLVIIAAWPCITVVSGGQRVGRAGVWFARVGSAGALALGTMWFVTRVGAN